jgi:hypothetical protein
MEDPVDPTLTVDLLKALKAFGDVVLYEDWRSALDGDPPEQWSRVRTLELRARIDRMGEMLYRAKKAGIVLPDEDILPPADYLRAMPDTDPSR